jgi:acyl-CoA reductase-like NAD-dependent aldehyde dehydrogenase
MSVTTQSGSPQFPNVVSTIPASTQEEMDRAVEELRLQKDTWVKRSILERVTIINQLINDFAAVAKRWVAACQQAKGIGDGSPFSSEEWMAGPWPVLKNLRQLRQSLIDIETHGRPRIPGKVTTTANGQVVAGVFPQNTYDSIFFTGITAELWMEPEVTAETLPETQALAYRDKEHEGKVALVLGAGNISSIGAMDILYKLFVEDRVTILKMNPVNAYLGPLIAESFRALIEPGFLRVTYGGGAEGAYLCKHAGIDEIHITGSDKTFDAIVFGGGAEGATRKAQGKPVLTKRITGELGNVSPIIVVPGPWKAQDIAYQAAHIATTLTINAGFNCNATRVIIQHSGWQQREELLQAIHSVLKNVPTRDAYYPGARERQSTFVAEHPEAEQIGDAQDGQLPWTLITGVQPGNLEDICFTTEAFCGLFAETGLDAVSTADYIDRAVMGHTERNHHCAPRITQTTRGSGGD